MQKENSTESTEEEREKVQKQKVFLKSFLSGVNF